MSKYSLSSFKSDIKSIKQPFHISLFIDCPFYSDESPFFITYINTLINHLSKEHENPLLLNSENELISKFHPALNILSSINNVSLNNLQSFHNILSKVDFEKPSLLIYTLSEKDLFNHIPSNHINSIVIQDTSSPALPGVIANRLTHKLYFYTESSQLSLMSNTLSFIPFQDFFNKKFYYLQKL